MDATILAALHAAGLDSIVPILLALHALASATDAALPQPKPGSHWLPLRKLVSIAAGNVHHASNAEQPPIISWIQRIAGLLVSLLPPTPIAPIAPVAPAAPVRVQPVVSSAPPSGIAIPPVPEPAPAAVKPLFFFPPEV